MIFNLPNPRFTLKRRDEIGTVLVGSVILLFVLGIFGFAFLSLAGYEAQAVQNQLQELRIFWKAEEGLSKASAQIGQLALPDGYAGKTMASDGLIAEFHIDRLSDPKKTRFQVTAEVRKNENPGENLLALTSIEESKSASDFFMIIDRAGSAYFTTGDTIDSPFHSNGRINITGSPVFTGSVETGDKQEGIKCREFFPCDPPKISTNAPIYDFSHMAMLIRKIAPTFIPPNNVASIELAGKFYRISYHDYNNNSFSPAITLPLPQNQGLYFDGDVEIKGVLDGILTVGAAGNITILDDLVYEGSDAKTGKPDPSSPSLLGLIAERNVKVKQEQSPDQVGKGIRINAAIVALDKSFEVVNYRAYRRSMGTMWLWGNIVQVERGAIGSVRLRGSVIRGYNKSWHYDRLRLQRNSPPYFPALLDEKGYMTFKTVYWGRA